MRGAYRLYNRTQTTRSKVDDDNAAEIGMWIGIGVGIACALAVCAYGAYAVLVKPFS